VRRARGGFIGVGEHGRGRGSDKRSGRARRTPVRALASGTASSTRQRRERSSSSADWPCWGPSASEGPQKHDLTMFSKWNM
jgi:hypothetical protein